MARDENLKKRLKGRRVALVAHAASVVPVARDDAGARLVHSLDVLRTSGLKITAAFGPQHGMRGEKQYNMIESDDYLDPGSGIPVFSLYGRVRRPTTEMMTSFDVALIDLQDVGCRIYTYLTTLLYMLEACAQHKKEVWVLDRPNPAGRPIEGSYLKKGWESFVGAAALPMRHGLTLAEAARWMKERFKLDVELLTVPVEAYDPNAAPGFGWPTELAWVNPSPNMPTLAAARCYAGTVLFEGVNLSEGRGTTRPLELFGSPGLKPELVLRWFESKAPGWTRGCALRECYFEPTFDKFKGELCAGLQIHAEGSIYDHASFRPYRLVLGMFKALRALQPGALIWRQPPYEYEYEKLPIDLLNGGTEVREWVDDPTAQPRDLERILEPDEKRWKEERKPYLLYADG